MKDYEGGALMIYALPKVRATLADRGYDAGSFRVALATRWITSCIPSSNRNVPIPHDRTIYPIATRSRSCYVEITTGDASNPALTDAHTLSCLITRELQESVISSDDGIIILQLSVTIVAIGLTSIEAVDRRAKRTPLAG